MISFNYDQGGWVKHFFHTSPTRKPFFWRDIINYRSAFLLGVDNIQKMGVLLYSGSIDGLRVKCQETFGLIFFWVVKPFPHNFWIPYPVAPSVLSTNLHEVHGLLDNWLSDGKDSRIWLWAKNGNFFTKSFYNFLNNNGLRCLLRKLLWKVECPLKKKILLAYFRQHDPNFI